MYLLWIERTLQMGWGWSCGLCYVLRCFGVASQRCRIRHNREPAFDSLVYCLRDLLLLAMIAARTREAYACCLQKWSVLLLQTKAIRGKAKLLLPFVMGTISISIFSLPFSFCRCCCFCCSSLMNTCNILLVDSLFMQNEAEGVKILQK